MYRGIADLLGMTLLPAPDSIEGLFKTYLEFHNKYDFFLHTRKGAPTRRGKTGEFLTKVNVIEKVDRALPILLEKKPNVLVITGDHSSPLARCGPTAGTPVPVLVNSPAAATTRYVLPRTSATSEAWLR